MPQRTPRESRHRGARRLAASALAFVVLTSGGIVVGASPASAAPKNYYVDASNGSATYNGLSPAPGAGSGPFQTIQQCANVAVSGDTCLIRTGTYRETVDPADGTTFKPYNEEPVTVSGLNPITSGWSVHSGNIYRTTLQLPIAGYSDTGLFANQLFAGGAPMLEARSPNTSSDLVNDVTRATADSGSDFDTVVDADLPNIPGGWAGGRIYFRISGKYASDSSVITSATATTLQLDSSTLNTTPFQCQASCMGEGSEYFLYGKLAALDIANEWFYDSTTATLYAWAPNGNIPNGIEYKARTDGFDLRGSTGVTVTGLHIKGATITMDAASSNNMLDRLHVQYVSHFMTVPHDSIDEYGGIYRAHQLDTGIILAGYFNQLRNSIVEFSAGNGVALTGTANTVYNNVIHDVNYGATYAAGVASQANSTDNAIIRNTIFNTGRDGINVGLSALPAKAFVDNDISYNDLFNIGTLTNDLGGMYFCCSLDMSGTRIHHNQIRDTRNGYQIYLDAGSGNATMDHNVLIGNAALSAGIVVNGANSEQSDSTNVGNNKFYNNFLGNVFQSYAANGTYRNNIIYATPPTGTSSNNLSGWVGATDPQVVDPANFDYRVRSSSPAVNAGVVVPGIKENYVGSAPDIGPFEQGDTWRPGASFFNPIEGVGRYATASASSSYNSSYTPNNVNDSNSATRWNAAGDGPTTNQWVELALDSPRTISRVQIDERFGRVTSFALQWWNGTSWTNLATGTTLGSRTFTFAPITTSRVRLLAISATSSPSISEFTVFQVPTVSKPLITVTARGALRTASEKVGLWFTTKGSPIKVTELGRFVAPDNSRSHTLELVRASDEVVVASAVLNLGSNKARPDGFAYVNLTSPVTLQPNTSYYLSSTESQNGDQFYDVVGSVNIASDLITVNGGVWHGTSWNQVPRPGGYGPLTLSFQRP